MNQPPKSPVVRFVANIELGNTGARTACRRAWTALSEACHFRATRFAPSGEEMDEDDSTAKPRKLVRRAVQTRQREQ
jgi:hypothetical protein